MNKQHRSLIVWAALALSSFAPLAQAYLDPSTGSMILSAIVGILATLSLAIKTYWYKLKAFFSGNKRVSGEEHQSVPRQQDEQQPDQPRQS